MEIQVVYEDKNILVINKPFGLVVNRADSIKGETVQDWVEKHEWFEKLKNPASQQGGSKTQNDENYVYWQRSGVCHRLDKETSGCLLIAKNPESMKYYLGLFKDRKISKTYLALVHGKVDPKEGEVVLPLKRSIMEREKWRVRYDGKKAITNWKVLKYFKYETNNEHWRECLSLLEVGLKTGRTHQIRVHLSFLGWPIFADDKYLRRSQSYHDRKLLRHHFLHAHLLKFKNEDGVLVEARSLLPDDCNKLIEGLEVAHD